VTVRKAIYWAVQIIVLALLIKFGLWAYQNYRADGRGQEQQEVLDIDKECLMDADTGFCVCRHRWTQERLKVSREECVSLTQGR
jgi:hypothetical protein